MEKIVFSNGKTVSSQYLNEVQKGNKFTGDTRTDYYADPTAGDEAGWDIGQRDRIKDWEIADPRVDGETGIGRLAHDGIVLGWDETLEEPVIGVPSTRPAGAGGIGVTVEAGNIVKRDGSPLSWSRQLVQILPGANTTSYLYVLEQPGPVTVSMGNSLPSVTTAHIPLAKITLNSTGDGLATDPLTGDVVGTGYVDLRPNTFVGNLNTYPQNLTNTNIKSADYTVMAWDRVIADTSGGSIILTLPESPNDSDRIAVVDISGTFDRFPLIIRVNPTSTELLNNSSDDWIVNIRDAHLELFYHSDTGQWKFEEAPGSECNPVLGSFLSCGGREYIGDRLATECKDGALLPASYPNPSPGTYSFEPSQSDPTLGKCYRVYGDLVALYANGTGGLISIPNAPRCDRNNVIGTVSVARNIIHVDPAIGDDSIGNTGTDPNRPLRTLERALIEGARESRRSGLANDRYDRVMIELSPGDYYVDNSPGSFSTPSSTVDTGLIQRVSTGYTIKSVITGDRVIHVTVDVNDPVSTQPPLPLNLGRVLYSESGGVGNIARIEKQSSFSSNWTITLEYVNGNFDLNEELFYDNLSVVNPQTGGLIVPRGISVDGTDLRKVRLRPMYVPQLTPVQNDPQTERTAILKVTGGTYVSLLTFTDNPQYARSHNTVTSVAFASQAEINGQEGFETSYYSRINNLFKDVDGWGSEGLEPIPAETTIVALTPENKSNRQQDLQENQTGLIVPGGDSRSGAPIAYPGATRIRDTDGAILPLPDINSTKSSSPYVFNCSVRSIFGLNGLWADGNRVAGFRSMVTANFTQVSLQTDPNCFNPTTYFQDPPVNKEDGTGKQYKTCTTDLFKYRHFGMRGSNDAVIQIVSVFVIGNSDHFVSENGADLSITNSCSDFGDISLRGMGYKSKSFSQDERTNEPGYGGTRITQIIPPLPLSYSQLADGTPPTLEDVEINTGLVIDYNKTLRYVINNKTPQNDPPSTIRIYIQNSNVATQLSLSRPPNSEDIAFGQYTYTRKVSDTAWELSGGPGQPNRKRIYINGFDEVGNSILYTGDIQLADASGLGFDFLNDKSKIFVWDPSPADIDENGQVIIGSGAWYVNVRTIDILEETTDLDGDGYLLKRFDYAFRYKLLNNPSQQEATYATIDFIFNRSAVKIVRAIDRRRSENRVYRVVLEGFIKENYGIRRPQPYYVVEKQVGVSGYPLNGSAELSSDPLTVTQVLGYQEVYKDADSVSSNGKFITYLTKSSSARDVFTGDFYPSIDQDYPEFTENPDNSVTKIALELMKSRTGVYFSSDLIPSVTPITVKTSLNASTPGIRIGLRRPSVIRASGHTWEWTGYLNYDTAFPTFQGDPLEQDYALGKIIVEENGGRVYATGMNEEGSYYLGTTVFDLRSGEQFAIPLSSESEAGSVTNQVLNNVIIRNTLLMQDGSSLVMGRGTTLFFSNDTEFKSLTTGDITASSPSRVYADKDRAGLVQLASDEVIEGSRSGVSKGISEKAVVTASALARELNVRFDNSVSGGSGVTVTTSIFEGDPNTPDDDFTQFGINIGLPLNSDIIPFAGIKLGNTTGQQVTSIVSFGTGVSISSSSDEKLVTEKALVSSFVNLTSNQSIGGTKTFTSTISGSINGNAETVTGGVYTTGAQTIDGAKTFTSTIIGSINGNAETVTGGIYTTGAQTIGGTKTFTSTIIGSINGNAETVTGGVYTTGDQEIGGIKTFTSTIIGSINGNAETVTGGVYTTGDQEIGGIKTFTGGIRLSSITAQNITSTVTSAVGITGGTSGSDEKIATEKAIATFVQDLLDQVVPLGTIVMWSGSTAPTGWAICDGSNGTPDLQDKFVVGAGTSYSVGGTGGSADAVVVSHVHKPGQNTSGETGAFSITNGGGALTGVFALTPVSNTTADPLTTGEGYASSSTTNAYDPTGNVVTGESATGKNLPPYYALAFIMRIS